MTHYADPDDRMHAANAMPVPDEFSDLDHTFNGENAWGACSICGRLLGEHPPVDEPEPDEDPLPESLATAVQEAVDALEALGRELRWAGGRDSDNRRVRHFSAYHLADIEGNDDGGSWLARQLLADELRALLRPEAD